MAELPPIDIQPHEWTIVRDVLRRYVPDREVWAFGSRARRTARRYSDLDLAVVADSPLPLITHAMLTDAFSDSDLPWRVDIVDWATTTPAFQAIIERGKVVLQLAEPAGDGGLAAG